MTHNVCDWWSRSGLVHCKEQFWLQVQFVDFPRSVSSLSLWFHVVMCSSSRECGLQIDPHLLSLSLLDTMACTRWNKFWGLWWNDIWWNQEEHARGVWVCRWFVITFSLALSLSFSLLHRILLASRMQLVSDEVGAHCWTCRGEGWYFAMFKMPVVVYLLCIFYCRSRNKDKLRYRYPRGESYLDVIQRLMDSIFHIILALNLNFVWYK